MCREGCAAHTDDPFFCQKLSDLIRRKYQAAFTRCDRGVERVLAVIFDDHTGRDGAVGKKASFAANDHAADTGMDIAADCSLGFGDLLSKIYLFARLYQWFGRSSDMHRERQHDFLGCGDSLDRQFRS